MNWIFSIFKSSVGKKLLMAITGMCFCCFLIIHLVGNVTLYFGKDFFTAYVDKLHSFETFIFLSEIFLLILALTHICTGIVLFIQNLSARKQKYLVKQNAGGRSLASKTMPYTGIILLAFVIFHLVSFHFFSNTQDTLYPVVVYTFSNILYVAIYVFAMIVAGLHVSHGFWSAFQTIGINHPKYNSIIKNTGIIFSLIIGFGFGVIPIYFLLFT